MFLGSPDPNPYLDEWIRILPFSYKGVEIMLAKKNFNKIFKTEDNMPDGKL
jgi:hypothetical protein